MSKFMNLAQLINEATKPKTPPKEEDEEDLFKDDPSRNEEPPEDDPEEGKDDEGEEDNSFDDAFKDDPSKENPEGDDTDTPPEDGEGETPNEDEPNDDDGITPELEDPGAEMNADEDPSDSDKSDDEPSDETPENEDEPENISFLSLSPTNAASLNIQLYNRYKAHLNDINGLFIKLDTMIFETPETKANFKKAVGEQYDILDIYMRTHFIENIYDKNFANLITFMAKFTELVELIDSAQQQSNK